MSALRRDGADVLLSVRLTPNARRMNIGGRWTDARGDHWLQARVTAPPDKGRANEALLGLLADALNIPPSSILLEAGASNRLKRLRIMACTPTIEDAIYRLTGEERA